MDPSIEVILITTAFLHPKASLLFKLAAFLKVRSSAFLKQTLQNKLSNLHIENYLSQQYGAYSINCKGFQKLVSFHKPESSGLGGISGIIKQNVQTFRSHNVFHIFGKCIKRLGIPDI